MGELQGTLHERIWLDAAEAVKGEWFTSVRAAASLRAKARGPRYVQVRRRGRGSKLTLYNRVDLDAWMRRDCKADQCSKCRRVAELTAELERLRDQLGPAGS